jgi:hypothetical protein
MHEKTNMSIRGISEKNMGDVDALIAALSHE